MDEIAFVQKLKTCFNEGNISEVLNLYVTKENETLIQQTQWDIAPLIIQHMKETEDDHLIMLNKVLQRVIILCNPEDVVLSIYPALMDIINVNVFFIVLNCLKSALIKVSDHKKKFFIWCFHGIQMFVQNLSTEKNTEVTGNSKVLSVYSKVLEFYNDLITKLPINTECKLAIETGLYLRNLFGVPIVYLDREHIKDEVMRSQLESILEILIKQICLITQPNIHFSWVKRDCNYLIDEDIPFNKLAIAHFYYTYLIFKNNCIIQVWSKEFRLTLALMAANEFFTFNKHNYRTILVKKALHLCKEVFQSMEDEHLSHLVFDNETYVNFCKNLVHINETKETRKVSLEILDKYFNMFRQKGRFLLIKGLLTYTFEETGGIYGYMISKFKAMVLSEFLLRANGFKGYLTVSKICDTLTELSKAPPNIPMSTLKCPQAKRVLEHKDRIVVMLNFILFLLLRIKSQSAVQTSSASLQLIDTHLKEILSKGNKKSYYLNELELEFTECKECCSDQIKLLEAEEKGIPIKWEEDEDFEISVEGVPEMTTSEKLHACRASFVHLELIGSLIDRVKEVLFT